MKFYKRLKKIIPALPTFRKQMAIGMMLCSESVMGQTMDRRILLDKVIASVNEEKIFYSELEHYAKEWELKAKQPINHAETIKLLHKLVIQKMFLAEAIAKNITIPAHELQRLLNHHLTSLIQQLGSKENVEQYFHRSFHSVRQGVKLSIEEQSKISSVQQILTQQLSVTPAEVQSYFDSIPPEQLPYYPTSFEIRQLVINPKVDMGRMEAAKTRLLSLKESLLTGKMTFAEAAKKYSDDGSSAARGGEIGWVSLGVLDPAYEAAALALPLGSISDPISSSFGLHLIELLDRSKAQYNTRHILQRLLPTEEEINRAKEAITHIRAQIINGTLSMEEAIQRYSEEMDSRIEGGLITAYSSGAGLPSVLSPADRLDPAVYFSVEALSVGGVSIPQWQKKTLNWRLLYVKQKIPPHCMNLMQDYDRIYHQVLEQKKLKVMHTWVQTAKAKFVICFDSQYQETEQLFKG